MFWNRYFFPSFLAMLVVVSFHWLGCLNDLYNRIWWYDIPLHFLGGLWVALFTLWITSTQYGLCLKKYVTIKNLLLFVFCFGIAWEFLELALRFNSISDVGYVWDTTHDLIMDVLGASLVSFFYRKSL
jgi:hypothetical protein